jgi:hypothetical protein
MRRDRSIRALVFLVLGALAFGTFSTRGVGQTKGETKAPNAKMIAGEVTYVDPASKTLKVKVHGKVVSIQWGKDTSFILRGEKENAVASKGSTDDLKLGSIVVVETKPATATLDATRIFVTPASGTVSNITIHNCNRINGSTVVADNSCPGGRDFGLRCDWPGGSSCIYE